MYNPRSEIIEKPKYQLYFIKISEHIFHYLFLSNFQGYLLFLIFAQIYVLECFIAILLAAHTYAHKNLHPTLLPLQMFLHLTFLSSIISPSSSIYPNS